MDPLVTLFDSTAAPAGSLTPALAALYGGELALPRDMPGGRPWVVANFVETLDGVISFDAPGTLGGGPISGENEADHFVMGLLRALADAVIFGSGALLGDTGHVRVPEFVYPARAAEYAALRAHLGLRETLPLNVVVSASGSVDFAEPTFSYPGLRTLIVTTAAGAERISRLGLRARADVRVVAQMPLTHGRSGVSAREVLALLARDYGVRMALYEGGPRLLGSLIRTRLLDELFLTLAPQVAGRARRRRLALVEGVAFAAGRAPWASLSSARLAGSHLLLRYRLFQEDA